MLSSMKLAVQGMTLQMQKQDQIANNLANQTTVGYKESSLFASSMERYLSSDKNGVDPERTLKADGVYTNFAEGSLKKTSNSLDVAIKGTGFFTALTNNGMQYTRDGHFSLDNEGYLVTSKGDKVMGESGFIKIDSERGEVKIFENGSVVQDNQRIDNLRIADFQKPYKLLKKGNNYYTPKLPNNPELQSSGYALKQGFLETSNVNTIDAMTGLITSYRNFEAISKAMKSQDETLDKSVNQIAKMQ